MPHDEPFGIDAQAIVAAHLDDVQALFRVRMALGLLGFVLAGAILLYAAVIGAVPSSISATYHSPLGDVLVGTLCAIGVFLLAYRDFDPEDYVGAPPAMILTKHVDRWVARLSGAGAIGVALLPVDPVAVSACEPVQASMRDCGITGFVWHNNWMHYGAALAFLLGICVLCFRFFPRDRAGQRGGIMGVARLGFYYLAGAVIALCIALLGWLLWQDGSDAPLAAWLNARDGFFWLEMVAVLAFASAWIVKSFDYRLYERS